MTKTKRRTYTAVCERDEAGWWIVTVPELPGVVTQARRLDRVKDLAEDVIALWLDADPDSFDVTVSPHLPEPLARAVITAIDARARAADAQREAADSISQAAHALVDDVGMNLRDAGVILGVSHQRVQQVLHSEPHRAARTRSSGSGGDATRGLPVAASDSTVCRPP